jgi:hypothetical protein
MTSIVLVSLAVLALSLALARALIWRSKGWLGVIAGLIPIGVMEGAWHWSLDASIRDCMTRACASAGLPPGCVIAEFGCTEWSGLSRFIFWAAGFSVVVLFAVGSVVLAVVHARARPDALRRRPSDSDDQAAG